MPPIPPNRCALCGTPDAPLTVGAGMVCRKCAAEATEALRLAVLSDPPREPVGEEAFAVALERVVASVRGTDRRRER